MKDDGQKSLQQWLAPELAAKGVLRNEPWVQISAHQAEDMFSVKSLAIAAVTMVVVEPCPSADEITTFPLIAHSSLTQNSHLSGARLNDPLHASSHMGALEISESRPQLTSGRDRNDY